MWRRIRLFHVNVALYTLVVCLAVLFWDDLRWARDELPGYLQDDIGAPDERNMYRKARRWILKNRNLDEARELLERSIAIDPYGESVYWLGQCLFQMGRYDESLEQFERFLEFDATMVDTYFKISAIHERGGDLTRATRVLQRGLEYFSKRAANFVPRPDEDAESRDNLKAVETYERYRSSLVALRLEIDRLSSKVATK